MAMAKPATLLRDISPPPTGRGSLTLQRKHSAANQSSVHDAKVKRKNEDQEDDPSLAAIEAGKAEIGNHLEYFSQKLASVCRPISSPQLSIDSYKELYNRNQHRHGRHFVVHQHDHPISGVHYDLRLQFSETSTISFAIPYGLPGNPNSIRPNRMAIETRVHCLWNNLIESASHATGSLLIWDTGEYEILPYKAGEKAMTDDEDSGAEHQSVDDGSSHIDRLFSAFRDRHIRLRLHGTKLPPNYTVGMRLPANNDRSRQPRKPRIKRRRLEPSAAVRKSSMDVTDSDSEEELRTTDTKAEGDTQTGDNAAGNASDDDEDATIRENNSYPGANNTIGSIHQRNWFLSLDRRRSGFTKTTNGGWVGPSEPFFVYGRDHERSVVTGRTADDVMQDEGVEKFVGRKMWRPILE